MGKSTISMAIFNGYVSLPEGIRKVCSSNVAFEFLAEFFLLKAIERDRKRGVDGSQHLLWWFGTFGLFFHRLGMSWSHLTNSIIFQRARSTNQTSTRSSPERRSSEQGADFGVAGMSWAWLSEVDSVASGWEMFGRCKRYIHISRWIHVCYIW